MVLTENTLNLFLQLREILAQRAPQDIPVHAEVVVNEPIAHASDLGPLHIAVRLSERLGQVLDCLADDFEISDDRVLSFDVL